MQSVDRMTQLLELLSKYKDGLGIKEVSERLDLPLSSTHRMLSSLKKNQLISQDKITKKYKLGIKILSLAIHILNDMDIIKITRPVIEELSTKYRQLIFLTVLDNDRSICVDMVNNSKGMKFYVKLGSLMPAHCSASGKAIVAYMDEHKIDEILRNEERTKFTEKTLLETDVIKEDLENVKQNGYAICDEEMEIGVKAIGVPIYDRYGSIYSSITIMLMKKSQNSEYKIIQDLIEAAKKISKSLGYIE